jgi:hypothetical protein
MQEVSTMVMVTGPAPDPNPDPNAPGIKKGRPGKAKTLSKSTGGSLPGNPNRGRGSVRRGGRGGR